MTKYQEYYWKDPEHCRKLQRAKYKRYPDKIKAINKTWQENNKEYYKALINFGVKIWYECHHQNRPEKIAALIAMRNEFKSRRKAVLL